MTGIFRNRLLRLGGTYAIGNIVINGIGVLLVPLYTAYLTPADYGAVALLTVTVAVLTRGIGAVGHHSLTRFYYAADFERSRELLAFNLLLLTTAAAALLCLLYLAASPILADVLLGGEDRLRLVWLYGGTVLLVPVAGYCRDYLRLRDRARLVVGLGIAGVSAAACSAAVLLLAFDAGVYAMGTAAVVSEAVFLAGALPALLSCAGRRLRLDVLRRPLRYGLPLGVEGYADLFMHLGDRYILRLLRPVGQVGLYSFGYRFGQVFNQAYVEPTALASQPSILRTEGERDRRNLLMGDCLRTYLGVGVILATAVSLLSQEVVRILATREAFYAAALVIPWVAWGYLFHGLSRFFSFPLVFGHRPKLRSFLMLLAVVFNIAADVLLVWHFGYVGAAAGTMCSYLFLCILFALAAHRLGHALMFRARQAILLALGIGVSLLVPLGAGTLPGALGFTVKLLAGIGVVLAVWTLEGRRWLHARAAQGSDKDPTQ